MQTRERCLGSHKLPCARVISDCDHALIGGRLVFAAAGQVANESQVGKVLFNLKSAGPSRLGLLYAFP